MLLITCPYCEAERPEIEFAYAGEAHLARPADPSASSDEQWRDQFARMNTAAPYGERVETRSWRT